MGMLLAKEIVIFSENLQSESSESNHLRKNGQVIKGNLDSSKKEKEKMTFRCSCNGL